MYDAYFKPENSFGIFEYDRIYVRIRDLNHAPYSGGVCTAAWFYDLLLRDREPVDTPYVVAGCLSAYSEDCA